MHEKFINDEGLKNLTGHVNATVKDRGDGYDIVWVCPFCKDELYIDAVKYLSDHVIEDGRTGFAHCMGRDYAIFVPKLLPADFWQRMPAKLGPV